MNRRWDLLGLPCPAWSREIWSIIRPRDSAEWNPWIWKAASVVSNLYSNGTVPLLMVSGSVASGPKFGRGHHSNRPSKLRYEVVALTRHTRLMKRRVRTQGLDLLYLCGGIPRIIYGHGSLLKFKPLRTPRLRKCSTWVITVKARPLNRCAGIMQDRGLLRGTFESHSSVQLISLVVWQRFSTDRLHKRYYAKRMTPLGYRFSLISCTSYRVLR